MRKLINDEIKIIKNISEINNRKNWIQDLIIKEWVKIKKGVLTAYTGAGKNFLMYKIIHLFNLQKPDYRILVIVPRLTLKNQIQEVVNKHNFKNVEVTVVNTLANRIVKKDIVEQWDVLLIDELHNLCSDTSLYFSEIIPRIETKYTLGVSATLDKQNLEYLEKHNLPLFFDFPISQGYKCGLIPDYNIWNIPVDLTFLEKREYISIQNEYHRIIATFSKHDIMNPTGCVSACLGNKFTKIKYEGITDYSKNHAIRIGKSLGKTGGETIGLALIWRNIQTKRRLFLNKSKESILMVEKLLEYVGDHQVLVFCASIDICNNLANKTDNSAAYHSKISTKKREQNKQDFLDGKLSRLFVVNSMREGSDFPKLQYAVRQGFTSKARDTIQVGGRCLRFDPDNPNKQAHLFHIYVRDFTDSSGNLVKSQNLKWLQSGLKGSSFVTWCRTLNEIKL